MKKTYFILLSSLIACTSRGMDEASNALMRDYCSSSADEFYRVVGNADPIPGRWKAYEGVKESITMLRELNELTPDNLCNKITTQLHLAADQYNLSDKGLKNLKRLYELLYENILPVALLGNKITRYDVTRDGSQIAVIEEGLLEDPAFAKPAKGTGLTLWKEMPALSKWNSESLQPFQRCTSIFITGNSFAAWAKEPMRFLEERVINSDTRCVMLKPEIDSMRWVHNDAKLLFKIHLPCANKHSYISFDCKNGTQDTDASPEDVAEFEKLQLAPWYLQHHNVDDDVNVNGLACCITKGKTMYITKTGILIKYKPTLKDIAEYLIMAVQKAESQK